MTANTAPIYSITPKTGAATWLPATTANTKSDGTGTIGTDILLAYTAGSNGAFIQRIRLNPCASVASTATTATVARVFLSSVTSGATTNLNTLRWDEVACPAQTADQTATANNFIEIPMGIAIAPNATILVSMHAAAAANTSWQFTVIGGDY